MGIYRVTTAAELETLVSGLCNPQRREPWCIITSTFDGTFPLDPEAIASQTSGISEVWVVPTGRHSYKLDELLPEGSTVFGGAARTFPGGSEWMRDVTLTRRHMPGQTDRENAAIMENVTSDVQAMAYRAGLLEGRKRSLKPTTAIIKTFLADGARAVVELPNGTWATLAQELTTDVVRLDSTFDVGQVLEGTYDDELKTFLIDLPTYDQKQFLETFPPGTVTLAWVSEVSRQRGSVTVFPGLDVPFVREDLSPNPKDRVDLLLAKGDIITVRILRNANGKLAVRMHDVDDDEIIEPPLSLVPGGKPWLTDDLDQFGASEDFAVEPIERFLQRFGLDRPEFGDDDSTGPITVIESDQARDTGELEVATSELRPRVVPTPGTYVALPPAPATSESQQAQASVSAKRGGIIESLNLTITALKAQLAAALARGDANQADRDRAMRQEQRIALAELVSERDKALEQARILRSDKAELRKALSVSQRQHILGLDYDKNRSRFAADSAGGEQWLRFEINLAWVERLPHADRAARPLPDFNIGPQFVASLADLSPGKKNKALKAVVDVLVADPALLASREVHPLRTGDGANDPALVRDDGAKCMRAYIEEKAPSARRLHYWSLPNGRVELSRIVLHDDMQP